MRRARLCRALGWGAFVVLCATASPALARAEPSPESLRRVLAEPGRPAALRELYASEDDVAFWIGDGGPNARSAELVQALLHADDAGLEPGDYAARDLDRRRRELAAAGESEGQEAARFEVDLSAALLRLVSDLHVGRVAPRSVAFGLDPAPDPAELVRLVRDVASSPEPAAALAAVEPQLGVYRRLKQALAHHRRLAEAAPEPALPDLPVLRPGDEAPGVPAVRRRLVALGDLGAGEAGDADRLVYDEATVAGVKRFQRRHGLAEDGVVGPRTLRELRVPLARRVEQIELSLERLRWLPPDLAERVVLVNIPEFRLHAARRGEKKIALQSPVVVGSAAEAHRTPVLRADMTHVVFRPYWNVPASIARNELLPKGRRAPGALAKDGFEIVVASGADAGRVAGISSGSLDAVAAGRARLRQRPGPDNALGLVKFIFPNPKQVYLHDTPSKALFGRSRRDFSHGCIRVGEPAALAEWLLAPQGFTADDVERAMQGAPNRQVDLKEPVSVVLFYTTAVVQGDGTVFFFDDIYGHDAVLSRRLREGRGG